MVTWSVVMPQAPLLMLQRRIFTPMLSPLTVAVGDATSLKVAVPCTTDHDPVARPLAGVAFITAVLLVPQRLWSVPASAACALPLNSSTFTTSLVTPLGHTPLFTVQANWLVPSPRAVMVVLGSLMVVMVPEPLTTVHTPEAGKATALPLMVVLESGVQKL